MFSLSDRTKVKYKMLRSTNRPVNMVTAIVVPPSAWMYSSVHALSEGSTGD